MLEVCGTEASEQAEAFLQSHPETHARFDRVADLIDGFETPYGMELLATVHWVTGHEAASDANEAVAKVYAWNDRKRMFSEQHLRIAWDVLHETAWFVER